MTYRSSVWARCIVPKCGTRALNSPLCHQHRHIVGWRVAAGVQAAWQERGYFPDKWIAARAELLELLKERPTC
jgi:hypothetical protein